MDIVQNIVLGVIGSLIASFLFELLRGNSDWFPNPSRPPVDMQAPTPESDAREMNRRRAKMAFFNGFFFLYTFFITYQAVSLPPIVKVMLSKKELLLSDAKYIGVVLPNIAITNDIAQIGLLAVTIAVYIPLFVFITFLAQLLAPVVDKFVVINIVVWRKIQAILFVVFAALLAVLSIWLFYPLTLKDAGMNFLAVIALGMVFILAGKR